MKRNKTENTGSNPVRAANKPESRGRIMVVRRACKRQRASYDETEQGACILRTYAGIVYGMDIASIVCRCESY